jgi:hypothetical protein
MNQHFTPHKRELRTHVDMACAAYHLGRQSRPLRVGASIASRPLRPVRFSGRLARPVGEIWRLRSEVASDRRDTVSLKEKRRGVAPTKVTAARPVKVRAQVKPVVKK